MTSVRAPERTQGLLKAYVVGETETAQSNQDLEGGDLFSGTGALGPPYDPLALAQLAEHSSALRPNLDAYAVNIDGFGHRLEPAIDLEAEDAEAQVADAIYLERAHAEEDQAPQAASEGEIEARLKELLHQARLEKARLRSFFDFCCFDQSFVGLRRQTREDLETTGNAYWEILRDLRGRIVRFVYVPNYSIRLLPLETSVTEVEDRIQVSPVSFEKVPVQRRLRKYVQVQGAQKTYFKEFSDPRVVSRKSGAVFETVEALRKADSSDGSANEILHFAIHSSRSPYGVPRWIGALLSVLGSRQMEEVNYLYFENKSVPPMALLVSGGNLNQDSIPRIERFIEENIKGKDNFHKILILEAEGSKDSGQTKIELKPLTDAQQQDALFQVYDERNIEKVGSTFRLPKLLRGESKDFNRATAQAALRFAEDQVFQPERDEFDHLMNRKIFSDMGISFWRFRSQTPVTRDPERMTGMVEKLVRVGVLTPEEGRLLAADIFNREFRKIGDDWTKRPITLTLAGIQNQGLPEEKDNLLEDAERLIEVQKALDTKEASLAAERIEEARRLAVPKAEFESWFE